MEIKNTYPDGAFNPSRLVEQSRKIAKLETKNANLTAKLEAVKDFLEQIAKADTSDVVDGIVDMALLTISAED